LPFFVYECEATAELAVTLEVPSPKVHAYDVTALSSLELDPLKLQFPFWQFTEKLAVGALLVGGGGGGGSVGAGCVGCVGGGKVIVPPEPFT
jgi:hypothetical protein